MARVEGFRRLAYGAFMLAAACCAAHAAGQAPAETDYGAVGYAEIDDVIDRFQDRYLERAIEGARAAGVDTLLIRIDTDGGEVHYARTMFKRILDLEAAGIRTVAFVDFRAISAGALIAYAHEEVYLSETASIGDIGVVFQSPEGEIKYAPEKIETVVRTLLAQAAEQRGWSRGLLLKMTRAQAGALTASPAPTGRWTTSSRTISRNSSRATPGSTATIRGRSSSTAAPTACSP